MATNTHPYQRGFRYESTLQGPDVKSSQVVQAGPIKFYVAPRTLTTAFLESRRELIDKVGVDISAGFDDFGATIHVCDEDGAEWLRFDCFANEPHYHYSLRGESAQIVCRIDEVAEGDPTEWVLGRIRDRLTDMLDFVGAAELARWSETHSEEIAAVADRLPKLMAEAGSKAAEIREQTAASTG